MLTDTSSPSFALGMNEKRTHPRLALNSTAIGYIVARNARLTAAK